MAFIYYSQLFQDAWPKYFPEFISAKVERKSIIQIFLDSPH